MLYNRRVMTDSPLLVASSISKRFGGAQALRDVSVSFRPGEVHALMGENGAGKSTLGKIIAGLHAQDDGTVAIGGRALRPGSIDDAYHAGVRIVHQELAQCPNLTVAENLCLHELPTRRGFVDRRRMIDRAARLLSRLDPGIDVRTPLGALPPGRRQIVQIASCLVDRARGASNAGARLIVFDEPTSSLSISESDRLLEIVRELAKSGIAIVYVSHRMAEIFSVCDRVTVLRDGRFVATSAIKDIDEAALVEQMVGRRLGERARRATPQLTHESPAALEVRELSSPDRLRDVSLRLRPGEIVGLGGLVGCGRSELLDAIFGLDPRASGAIRINGERLDHRGPRAAIRAGVGYLPEDRRLQGLFFQIGGGVNVLMPYIHHLSAAFGVRRRGVERELIDRKLREFQVKLTSRDALPGELSGGNQQKLLLARWIGDETKVLLLDEPTRGVDVVTKWEVHQRILAAAERGAAVLLASSEMPELLALADRVLVMREGSIAGELAGGEMTQANILRLATGATC